MSTNGFNGEMSQQGFVKLAFPIDVSLIQKDSDGFQDRQDFRVTAEYDVPLWETIITAIPLATPDRSEVTVTNLYECYAGNFKGQCIDLSQTPLDIPYIMDVYSNDRTPTIFLCHSSDYERSHKRTHPLASVDRPSTDSSNESCSPYGQRRGSTMVRKLLEGSNTPQSGDEEPVFTHLGMNDESQSNKSNAVMAVDSDIKSDHPNELETQRSNSCGDMGPDPVLIEAKGVAKTKPKRPKSVSFHVQEVEEEDDEKEDTKKKQLEDDGSSSESDNVFTLNITMLSGDSKAKRDRYSTLPSPMRPAHSTTELIPRNKAPARTLPRPSRMSMAAIPIIEHPKIPEIPRSIDMDPPHRHRSTVVNHGRNRWKAFRRRKTSTFDLTPCSIKLKTEDGWSTSISCYSITTVGELKHTIIGHALREDGKMKTSGMMNVIYEVEGTQYELLNETQLVKSTYYYEKVLKPYSDSTEEEKDLPELMVTFGKEPSHKELVNDFRISQLTGVILDKRVSNMGAVETLRTISGPDQPEVEFTRRTLHDHVLRVIKTRNDEEYALSPDIITTDAPIILKIRIPLGDQVPMTFHYRDEFSFTKNIKIYSYACDVLAQLFPCVVACGLVKDKLEDYTLQVSGKESYIHGKVEMIAFKEIRRCVLKQEPIHLSVTAKPTAELYRAFNYSTWLQLDPHSSLPPLQSDLTSDEIGSIWECDKDYRLGVVRVENLPFGKPAKVSVEISVHHGAKLIHSARSLPWVTQDNYTMHWSGSETVSFHLKIKNIPKEAKMLVLVRRSTSKKFHWGLITMIDHFGQLRHGEHTLHLWEAKSKKEIKKELQVPLIEQAVIANKLNTILSGPVTNNPSRSAVRAVIRLVDDFEKPICYPSTCSESRQAFFTAHPALRNATMRRFLAKFMVHSRDSRNYEGSTKYFVDIVNWGDFTQCLEVYNLLDEMEEDISRIQEYVALKLLDSDYPSKEVREFAVSILEKNELPNEKLETYLLQLTHALKFEPYHDSALARFLLKRALTCRKIGHFLFWYLKSELQDSVNSQYMARFAVILEAYLRGCGEAMLTRFKDQYELEKYLEEIAHKVKPPTQAGKGDAEKMQEILKSELTRRELQKLSFVPVFNSRIKMGKMRIDKCKIMGSAKRPMWLELQNVNSTALEQQPVRLIYKRGDDLRQDMITLKMFTLFETLWEDEGLDLKLIPYGCVATGAKSGFIEVVKNARTIKDVSGVREPHKLYEWIKSHQKNEFGEEDPEKLKEAIDTFVHSCAGYSVATYILGIGDRHNDNIMINTSGNLFHIDFGHFLGNIKHFMGFKREWAPFVLTPDFVYVMGGENSQTFDYYKHLCVRAFHALRRNANLIVNLITMMRSTGIPELTCVEDTDYIRSALVIDKSDAEAERCFRNVIKKCLNLKWTVQIMWAAHIITNGSSPNKSS